MTSSCKVYQFITPMPPSGELVAKVNDQGTIASNVASVAPFVEMDYTNNEHTGHPVPFTISFPRPLR